MYHEEASLEALDSASWRHILRTCVFLIRWISSVLAPLLFLTGVSFVRWVRYFILFLIIVQLSTRSWCSCDLFLPHLDLHCFDSGFYHLASSSHFCFYYSDFLRFGLFCLGTGARTKILLTFLTPFDKYLFTEMLILEIQFQMLNNVIKFSAGRLRPHFFKVCKPDIDVSQY